MEKRKNLAVVCLTAAFLLGFLVWSLLKPDDTVSQSERRKLAQKPELTAASVLNGTFMTDFESYTLDQFPLRDGFRRLKAAVLLDMLREKDNNGIYLADGYAAKLEAHGLYTMGDIARCSIGKSTDYHNEELLYKLFGVNAELLIDHAWGWEPCTIADIKAYKPENKSIVSGQILQYPYPFEKARLVIQEMADALALELVDKRLATNQLVLTVGYDIENLKGTAYTGEVTTDRYGRKIPKHAHGTVNLDGYTSSGEELLKAATSLYDRIVDKTLLARRLTLCANHLLDESSVPEDLPEQIDLFTDYSAKEKQKKEADTAHARERKLQETMLDIKKRFGKNAILKGLNLEDGATARERNNQIGGHKA